jgi:hypothetical protein
MNFSRYRSANGLFLAVLVVANVVAAFTVVRKLEAQDLPCFLSGDCYCQMVASGAGFCGEGPDENGSKCYGNFMCGSSEK